MRQFHSRRNDVFESGGIVYKCFSHSEAAAQEAAILRQLKAANLPVPCVQHQLGRVIAMEYLPGETLPDLLCKEPSFLCIKTLASGLVDWLQQFYHAVDTERTHIIRGDINGRNFLIQKNGTVWGVDFESFCYGTQETDVGRLIAFIETYRVANPALSEALTGELFSYFTNQINLNKDEILLQRALEFQAMESRRNESITPVWTPPSSSQGKKEEPQ